MHAQTDSADPANGNRPPQQGCQGRAGKNRQVDVGQEYRDTPAQSSGCILSPAAEAEVVEQARRIYLRAHPPRWMTTLEAAEYSGFSENYVCREAVAGRLPSSKRGKARRFHVEALDAWVRAESGRA